MFPRAAQLFLFVVAAMGTGCGYLDSELFLSDQAFAESIDMEEMSFGSGAVELHRRYSGPSCGGFGFGWGEARMHPGVIQARQLSMGGIATLEEGAGPEDGTADQYAAYLADAEAVAPVVGGVEQVYFDVLDARATSVTQFVSGRVDAVEASAEE